MMATHEMLKKVVQEELGTVFFLGGKNVVVGCFGRQGRGIYKNLVSIDIVNIVSGFSKLLEIFEWYHRDITRPHPKEDFQLKVENPSPQKKSRNASTL